MDKNQTAAVESTARTILTVAGPGSGKTRTLISRVRHLIQGGTPPGAIAVLTFTQAAANELETRIDETFLTEVRLGFCGTLHSFCLDLLRRGGQKITVIDADAEVEFLESVMKSCRYKGTMTKVREALAAGPMQLGASPGKEEIVASAYWRTLRVQGLVTFDGLLWSGLALIRRHPEHLAKFKHLLVDEFQDSSAIDHALYGEMPIENKFFVGDHDQSIYAFRGAWSGGMVNLGKAKGVELHTLENNYRSDAAICWHAQQLIQHNKHRLAKDNLSVSGEPGAAIAVGHEGQQDEMRWLAGQVLEHDTSKMSVAVLCRKWFHVNLVAEFLKASGVRVAERKLFESPPDWRLAKLLLAMFEDPWNDWVASQYLKVIGDKERDTKAAKAVVSGVPLSEYIGLVTEPVQIGEVAARLAKSNVCAETVCSVAKIIEALNPERASIGDVLLAMSEAEHHDEAVGDGVMVTTMHGAKGHEYDTVYLPCFEQEIIPGLAAGDDVEEERRIAYVAMTRARHKLVITFARHRAPRWGNPEPLVTTPSRFIAEAGLFSTNADVAHCIAAGIATIPVRWEESTVNFVVKERQAKMIELAKQAWERRAKTRTSRLTK